MKLFIQTHSELLTLLLWGSLSFLSCYMFKLKSVSGWAERRVRGDVLIISLWVLSALYHHWCCARLDMDCEWYGCSWRVQITFSLCLFSHSCCSLASALSLICLNKLSSCNEAWGFRTVWVRSDALRLEPIISVIFQSRAVNVQIRSILCSFLTFPLHRGWNWLNWIIVTSLQRKHCSAVSMSQTLTLTEVIWLWLITVSLIQ